MIKTIVMIKMIMAMQTTNHNRNLIHA